MDDSDTLDVDRLRNLLAESARIDTLCEIYAERKTGLFERSQNGATADSRYTASEGAAFRTIGASTQAFASTESLNNDSLRKAASRTFRAELIQDASSVGPAPHSTNPTKSTHSFLPSSEYVPERTLRHRHMMSEFAASPSSSRRIDNRW